MTAKGTLYIDEDCRDVFQNELNEWFGEDWHLNGEDFAVENLSKLPNIMKVTVENRDRTKKLGRVEIVNHFFIADYYGKCIEVEPKSISLIDKNEVV